MGDFYLDALAPDGEKKAAVEGMLRLVKGGAAEATSDRAGQVQSGRKQALN